MAEDIVASSLHSVDTNDTCELKMVGIHNNQVDSSSAKHNNEISGEHYSQFIPTLIVNRPPLPGVLHETGKTDRNLPGNLQTKNSIIPTYSTKQWKAVDEDNKSFVSCLCFS